MYLYDSCLHIVREMDTSTFVTFAFSLYWTVRVGCGCVHWKLYRSYRIYSWNIVQSKMQNKIQIPGHFKVKFNFSFWPNWTRPDPRVGSRVVQLCSGQSELQRCGCVLQLCSMSVLTDCLWDECCALRLWWLEPSNYIVVADMTHISLVGLESGSDRSIYSVVYGQFFNSFTAVTVDSLRHLIYYTDVNRLLVVAYLLISWRCYDFATSTRYAYITQQVRSDNCLGVSAIFLNSPPRGSVKVRNYYYLLYIHLYFTKEMVVVKTHTT